MGDRRNAYEILVEERPLGRPSRGWKDGVRIDCKEIGMEGVNWIDQSRDRTGSGLL
jgi:hypothetical protein